MKNYITILFTAIFILLSCNDKGKNNDDFEVINDVFPDLFIKDYLFESFKDYQHRNYSENELEKYDIDSLYTVYEKNKQLKKKFNVFVFNKLDTLNIKDIDLIEGINDYGEFDLEEVKFNPKEKIKLPEKISLSSFEEATIAAYKFSRVYFDKNKEKAFFIFKLTCFDGCYNEHIVFAVKKENKWVVDKTIMIATS
ncbi:hypothetical protein [Tenacibaculum discolor]|uniref:hypothetical protein n=1 Tax=Tenacibaculum discolor TaxID=361581 RepID=UPI003F791A35